MSDGFTLNLGRGARECHPGGMGASPSRTGGFGRQGLRAEIVRLSAPK